jgi:glucokinase
MFIAGDIGGTKSNLGAFQMREGKLVRVFHERYASQQFRRAEDLVSKFANQASTTLSAKVAGASFGIAGPVVNNCVRATNLPWVVSGANLASLLGVSKVRLLNDLEATAYGVLALDPSELETIHPGVAAPNTTKSIVSAGTGLGEAILFWDGARHVPMPTEGGHADWAPRTEREIEFWRYMKTQVDIVSNETIISGRGFRLIHNFLGPDVKHPIFDDLTQDAAPLITHQALENTCPVCVQTVDMWIEIYGAEAGNLALRSVSRGGVYIAGGIALKLLPKLSTGKFVSAFQWKEKLSAFLSQIPIQVVLNEDAPLIGAATVAAQTA